MVGALVPMVPEGLVLMTSIAFAVGVVRLGRRQCLVQELPAIEGLARVDVVCADKTGTLTENGMRLADVTPVGQDDTAHRVADVLASLAADDPKPNASMQAIAEAYPDAPGWTATAAAPFKSATKWSGVSYGEHGNWLIGAPDVLLDPESAVAAQAEEIGARGMRVLLALRQRRTRRQSRRARSRHPGRAGGPRTAGPPRRPRHLGILRFPERHGQGDLR